MKKIIFIILLVPIASFAQLELRATLSNTILNIGYGKGSPAPYHYGGAGFGAVSFGMEGELRLKKLSYLKNDSAILNPRSFTSSSIEICLFYSNHNYSVPGLAATNDPISSMLDIQLLQIPIILKGNAHIFVLDESFRISFGIGIVNSLVLKSRLSEEARIYVRDVNGNLVQDPDGNYMWQDYADAANTTRSGKRFYNSFCFELSFGFKRLFIAERAWFAFQDMYWDDAASSWNVPRSHSVYFNAYDTWPKVTYGGGSFSIGWKLN